MHVELLLCIYGRKREHRRSFEQGGGFPCPRGAELSDSFSPYPKWAFPLHPAQQLAFVLHF